MRIKTVNKARSISSKQIFVKIMLVLSITFANFSSLAADKMIDIGSNTLHAIAMGKGEYTIILESGFGSDMNHWRKVAPELSKDNMVFAYSRAGYGKSSKVEDVRDLTASIFEFEKLIAAESLHPPFILVSHSYGALISRGFAQRNPKLVAGMVLVDPMNPSLFKELIAIAPEKTKEFLDMYSKMVPAHLQAEQKMLSTIEEKGEMPTYGNLPDVPAVVITAMKQEYPQFIIHSAQGKKIWRKLHTQWFNEFTLGRHVITPYSGHNIALEEPETVIESIQFVINAAKKQEKKNTATSVLKKAKALISLTELQEAESIIFAWLAQSELSNEEINTLGYRHLNNTADNTLASFILKYNVKQNPELANAYDSYGEALMSLSKFEQAKMQFETALVLAKKQGMSEEATKGFEKNLDKATSSHKE